MRFRIRVSSVLSDVQLSLYVQHASGWKFLASREVPVDGWFRRARLRRARLFLVGVAEDFADAVGVSVEWYDGAQDDPLVQLRSAVRRACDELTPENDCAGVLKELRDHVEGTSE